jgi:DNA-directed RNA polymerase I subunit RPA2
MVDLDEGGRSRRLLRFFANPVKKNAQGKETRFAPELDEDGLPAVGTRMVKDAPYYCFVDGVNHRPVLKRFKHSEEAIIDQVRIISSVTGNDQQIRTVSIKLRINRNPIIGDKFSSRHGQKVCTTRQTDIQRETDREREMQQITAER